VQYSRCKCTVQYGRDVCSLFVQNVRAVACTGSDKLYSTEYCGSAPRLLGLDITQWSFLPFFCDFCDRVLFSVQCCTCTDSTCRIAFDLPMEQNLTKSTMALVFSENKTGKSQQAAAVHREKLYRTVQGTRYGSGAWPPAMPALHTDTSAVYATDRRQAKRSTTFTYSPPSQWLSRLERESY